MNIETPPSKTEKACTRCKAVLPLETFGWVSKIRKGGRKRYRDSWCGDCRIVYKRLAHQRLKANATRRRRLATSDAARAAKKALDQAYYLRNREKRQQPDAYDRREGWLDNRLKRKYGISVEQYLELSQKQAHRCAICGREARDQSRRLAVDHDHDNHRVRELLCHHCNTGLGNFEDNPALLEAAIAYLARHGILRKVPA